MYCILSTPCDFTGMSWYSMDCFVFVKQFILSHFVLVAFHWLFSNTTSDSLQLVTPSSVDS